MRSFLRAAVFIAVGILPGLVTPASAHNCSCSASSCTVTCSEADLRSAVAVVNGCSGTTSRTINVPSSCVMSMGMTSATASCGNDNANKYNAICITASNITINGGASATSSGATFVYGGAYICASCDGECDGPQPALFLLKGSGNKLRNFTMKYFPEGLHIKQGANHVIDNVKNDFICEDAITINNDASVTGAQVIKSKLTGNTSAESAHACYQRSAAGPACGTDVDCASALPSFCAGGACACYCGDGTFGTSGAPCPASGLSKCHRESLCGLDKAIQINGGASTIGGSSSNANTINTIGQPVHVSSGTHTISFNTTDGNLNVTGCHQAYPGYCALTNNCDDVCQGYVVEGASAIATLTSNTISYCKFGIRSRNGGTITATSNTLKDNYLSAFQIDGTPAGKIKGQTNRMKYNGCFTQSSQSARAALVVLDNTAACIDFGKGNFSGQACIGTSKSSGGNLFCNDASTTDGLIDVWNIGAPVGAQANKFDGSPELGGPGSGSVNTSGFGSANCNF